MTSLSEGVGGAGKFLTERGESVSGATRRTSGTSSSNETHMGTFLGLLLPSSDLLTSGFQGKREACASWRGADHSFLLGGRRGGTAGGTAERRGGSLHPGKPRQPGIFLASSRQLPAPPGLSETNVKAPSGSAHGARLAVGQQSGQWALFLRPECALKGSSSASAQVPRRNPVPPMPSVL